MITVRTGCIAKGAPFRGGHAGVRRALQSHQCLAPGGGTLLDLLRFDHTKLTYHFQGKYSPLTDVDGDLVTRIRSRFDH